jgi:hypothetical protein
LVRDARQAHALRHFARLLTLLALAGAWAGCGGKAENPQRGDDRGAYASGSTPSAEIRLADCADWNQASAFERNRVLEELTKFAGSRTGSPTGGRGAVLEESRAGKLFDNWCSRGYTDAFKLYKLYTRAAAFSGH